MSGLNTTDLRAEIRASCLRDEHDSIALLRDSMGVPNGAVAAAARARAIELITRMRQHAGSGSGLTALLHEYDLSSREGVLLMCLAEALLRIPDRATADRFVHDTITRGAWEQHLGADRSLFVNASTWSLILTGRWLRGDDEDFSRAGHALKHFLAEGGEPLVRGIMKRAVRIIAGHFILAPTIVQALDSARENEQYSYDMLGEAALGATDAARYHAAYLSAIEAVGRKYRLAGYTPSAPDISVKLSALHPRFEERQRLRVLGELTPRLLELAHCARERHLGLTIDAEETERLELTLDVFETIYRDRTLADWAGLGLAVQTYQKRAPATLDWLGELARDIGRPIGVRLVKGAYWDSEIKQAQERGLTDYPVFTYKEATDLCYQVCAAKLLDHPELFRAQFATHNSHTVAWLLSHARSDVAFEFQRLHGMGEILYTVLDTPRPCRVYAPVGAHADLLPYLVRRLLENGAGSSFVNRYLDDVRAETLAEDPLAALAAKMNGGTSRRIPRPPDLYGATRKNSVGVYLSDPQSVARVHEEIERGSHGRWRAAPRPGAHGTPRRRRDIRSPADRSHVVGTVEEADETVFDEILGRTAAAFGSWRLTPPAQRAAVLERAADLMERRAYEFMSLCVFEGGKIVTDALAEVREAVDSCRYYGAQLRTTLRAIELGGVTGESNQLSYRGRGVFACISPWNFPLAIFVGQVSAALAAGNCVVAKPAGQTPLVAALAVDLLHEAGVPEEVLCLMPGAGSRLGATLVSDPRVAGVAFTGSTATAGEINRRLAVRPGAIIPFIAETGGQNVMIADSSALTEQVVRDVIVSAFDSAGQRCSALRVLFVQEDIADLTLATLAGAMREIRVGHPRDAATDVGPVINEQALTGLHGHCAYLAKTARLIQRVTLPSALPQGHYFGPVAYEIECLGQLPGEVFGPVLHVIRYAAGALETVIDEVNDTGYGLTLGVHSRIDDTVTLVVERARVGNIYVNRNMIGAVVGAQPFGGQGLSGTGPKAGGPDYIKRFAVEQTLTVNTAAVGGNTDLLSGDTV